MPFGSFYNTSPPTPNSLNTINSVSIGIRDFLLNKNLLPFYPQITTAVNGGPLVGQPVTDTSVGTNNVVQPFGLPLEVQGISYMQTLLKNNLYINPNSTSDDLVEINNLLKTGNDFPNSTQDNGVYDYSQNIDTYGIQAKTVDAGFRQSATLMNLYMCPDNQIDMSDYIDLNTSNVINQVCSYTTSYNSLNSGNNSCFGSISASDIINSLETLVDTQLGIIGGQQLSLAIGANNAFDIAKALLCKVSISDNISSLINNGTLAGFIPDYSITIPSGGDVVDYLSKILGNTTPYSYLSPAGSIYQSENGNAEQIARSNSMLLNTGSGQALALLNNINANLDINNYSVFSSGYAPSYVDNKGKPMISASNSMLYSFDDGTGHFINLLSANDGIIPDLNYQREQKVSNSGFIDFQGFGYPQPQSYNSSNIKYVGFSWTSNNGQVLNATTTGNNDEFVGDKKNILSKTQQLFNSVGMKNIVSVSGLMGVLPSQINTAVVGYGISKGNAVMSINNFDLDNGIYNGSSAGTADNTYCRSWTTFNRYDNVNKLIRNSSLDPNAPFRNKVDNSILGDNGFPKIAPYVTDLPTDPKNYMFSIENLAWCDNLAMLPACEIGNGDLISGKQGRVMWFPPYDINFNENISVNWETNDFIGRGESLYTYNNTNRNGVLSFKIIVDSPSYINSFSSRNSPILDDHYMASFFAGCVPLDSGFSDKLTVAQVSAIAANNQTQPILTNDTKQDPPFSGPLSIYFPNDAVSLLAGYEDGMCGTTPIDYSTNPQGEGCGSGVVMGEVTTPNQSYIDNYNYGLNAGVGQGATYIVDGTTYSGITDGTFLPAIDTYLNNKCPNCVVVITGYASAQGTSDSNSTLAMTRATNTQNFLMPQLHTSVNNSGQKAKLFKVVNGGVSGSPGDCPNSNGNITTRTDSIGCKKNRYVNVTFVYDATVIPQTTNQKPPTTNTNQTNQNTTINKNIQNMFYTECNYFEELQQNDPFVFDKFRDKIRYFHPGFHSTTPEGLNSRLTFLQQCTRQGPTLEAQGANNLAFGRAPVCILRLGDFYNTKIIIDSISIEYEPIVWDLNPEGVGVQPMIANVSLSFKFIGGSTLASPLQKLQNALSSNYYANSQVYDVRADYIAKGSTDVTSLNAGSVSQYTVQTNYVPPQKTNSTSTTQAEIKSNSPSINQTAAASSSGTGPAPGNGAPPAPTTPTITGFNINIGSLNTIPNNWNIIVSLLATNANTTDDQNTLIKQGVIITIDNGVGNFKQVPLNTSFFTPQQLVSTGIPISFLPPGTYFISLSVGGNKISGENLVLK